MFFSDEIAEDLNFFCLPRRYNTNYLKKKKYIVKQKNYYIFNIFVYLKKNYLLYKSKKNLWQDFGAMHRAAPGGRRLLCYATGLALPCFALSSPALFCTALFCPTLFCFAKACPVISCLALLCPVPSYPVLSYPTVLYPMLPYLSLHCLLFCRLVSK